MISSRPSVPYTTSAFSAPSYAHLNARVLRDVLSGEERGAARDVILLNAGAATYVSGRKTIEEGVRLAEESITSGTAAKALENFVRATRRLSGVGGAV